MTDDTRTILVVEDDPIVRRVMVEALADGLDLRILEFRDGRSALGEIERRTPAAIVLDVGLPLMDGDDLCRRLKADPKTRGVPVICISPHTRAARALAAGCDEFLEKPFSMERLVAAVRDRVAA